jgi:hypothetical protein
MTHFLSRLVDRARGTASRVEPLIRSSFAPVGERETTPDVEASRLPADESKTASNPQHEIRGSSANESTVRPLTAGEANEAKLEESPLLVPHHSVPERESDRLSSTMPRTSTADTPAESSTTVTPRKVARATLHPRSTHGKQRDVDSSAISSDHGRAAPVVRVTIGRIDVRAAPAPASPPRRAAAAAKPALALDAYLKSRKEGTR